MSVLSSILSTILSAILCPPRLLWSMVVWSLRPLASATLQAECWRLRAAVEELTVKLSEADSVNRVQSVEIDELSAVMARNLKRVEAETAIEARKIAAAGVAVASLEKQQEN